VVVEAGRKGGYGNWVEIKHDGAWATGYGHMSRFGAGIHAGTRVHQGEVIGYIGATGEATGPHLHYEVMQNGVKINPRDAKVPAGGTQLTGGQLVAFESEKARIDGMIQTAQLTGKMRMATAEPVSKKADGLRPAQVAQR
jgi:murein DD-endopeptidase MepM/ murein hydrolase activator NlpD